MLRKLAWGSLLLVACQTEQSRVQLDLSSIYQKQGATLVPKAKVPFDAMVLAIAPGAIRTQQDAAIDNSQFLIRKVEPDPTLLTFETPAPVGSNYDVGLIGGRLSAEGTIEQLDYIGMTPSVSFTKDLTTNVDIVLVPAGLLNFQIQFSSEVETLLTKNGVDLAKVACQVAVQRDGAVADDILEHSHASALAQGFVFAGGDPLQKLTRGFQPMLTGHYTVSDTLNCPGFILEVAASTIDIAQSAVVQPVLTALKVRTAATTTTGGGGGGTTGVVQHAGFKLSVVDIGGTARVNVATADQARLVIEAVNSDGSVDTTYNGAVNLTLFEVETATGSILPASVGVLSGLHLRAVGGSTEESPGATTRALTMTNGVATYEANWSNDAVGATVFLAAEAPTNTHTAGYGMFNFATLGGDRCGPIPAGPQTFGFNSLLALSYVEHGSLLFNGTQPLASHTFVGLLWSADGGSTGWPCIAEPSALPGGYTVAIAAQHYFDAVQSREEALVAVQSIEFIEQPESVEMVPLEPGGTLFKVPVSSLGPLLQRTFFNSLAPDPEALNNSLLTPFAVRFETYFLDTAVAPFLNCVEELKAQSSVNIDITTPLARSH